jgi:ABC-type nitrate/sulfonate/bicarbonate transport system substrate-binding protein
MKPLLGVLFGFLSMQFSAFHAPAAEPSGITFGFSSIGAAGTGLWMAKEIGAFEKYGLNADVIYISSGPVVLQALIGGDLTVGLGASNSTVAAALRGAPVVAVGGIINKAYHRLFVQPDINRIEDLRGKTLGVTRFGSVTDNLTQILLRKYNLEGKVNVRQMGGVIEVGAAFQQKLIAGAVSSELRTSEQHPAKVLMKLVDMGIPYSMDMIVVSRDYLRRQPQTVERILRAYMEGIATLHQQKERALKVIAKYGRLSEPKKIEAHYQDSVDYLEKLPRINADAAATILEFMGKKDTPMETFADQLIVDRLAREGFVEKLYGRR